MIRKIKVEISKEDIYNVQELIEEIKDDPKSAFDLCEDYGYEGFAS
jgi:predicted AAA+ superfamily ATPase